jgi:hypothetical protein
VADMQQQQHYLLHQQQQYQLHQQRQYITDSALSSSR